jgi:hypothetical protein
MSSVRKGPLRKSTPPRAMLSPKLLRLLVPGPSPSATPYLVFLPFSTCRSARRLLSRTVRPEVRALCAGRRRTQVSSTIGYVPPPSPSPSTDSYGLLMSCLNAYKRSIRLWRRCWHFIVVLIHGHAVVLVVLDLCRCCHRRPSDSNTGRRQCGQAQPPLLGGQPLLSCASLLTSKPPRRGPATTCALTRYSCCALSHYREPTCCRVCVRPTTATAAAGKRCDCTSGGVIVCRCQLRRTHARARHGTALVSGPLQLHGDGSPSRPLASRRRA